MCLQIVKFTQNKREMKTIQDFPLRFGSTVINGIINRNIINTKLLFRLYKI